MLEYFKENKLFTLATIGIIALTAFYAVMVSNMDLTEEEEEYLKEIAPDPPNPFYMFITVLIAALAIFILIHIQSKEGE